MTSANSMHEARHPELVLKENTEGLGGDGCEGRRVQSGETCIPLAD